MELSGRSKDHLIDRITLSYNTSSALNLNNEETVCTQGTLSVNTNNPNRKNAIIKLFPNPVEHILTIELPQTLIEEHILIYDLKGLSVSKANITDINNKIDVSKLNSGFYVVRTGRNQSKIFIKK